MKQTKCLVKCTSTFYLRAHLTSLPYMPHMHAAITLRLKGGQKFLRCFATSEVPILSDQLVAFFPTWHWQPRTPASKITLRSYLRSVA